MEAAAAAECITTKPRATYRVPWELLVVRKKLHNLEKHPNSKKKKKKKETNKCKGSET